MNEIIDLPQPVNAGLEFDYSMWTPDTEITLVNVPWNNDYRDVVAYKDKTTLISYLKSRPHETIKWASRARISRPIRVSTPFTTVMKYNYVAVHNGAYPTGGEDQYFFYFITDVRDVTPSTTEIIVQLDVWQTFRYDVQIKSGYVERGHVGIANEDNYDHHGRTYLTSPEGLDVGNEYNICYYGADLIMDMNQNGAYDILALSSVDLTAPPMNGNNPNLVTATPSRNQNVPSGLGLFVWLSMDEFEGWLKAMAKYPHVTRGIISIWVVPDLQSFADDRKLVGTEVEGFHCYRLTDLRVDTKKRTVMEGWGTYAEMNIPAKYKHLKKFLTYPYTVIELTSHTGAPLILKPEAMDSDDVVVSRAISLVPPSPRISWMPWKYNSVDSSSDNYQKNEYGSILDDGCEWDDMQVSISNFPSLGVVNDGYMDYLNSNKNSIAQAYSSADWSQQKAMTGNQLAYNQANSNQQLFNQTTANQRTFMNSQAALALETNDYRGLQQQAQNAVGAIGNIAGGVATRNPGMIAGGVVGGVLGAANNAADWAINNNQINTSNNNSNRLLNANQAAQNANMNYVRDTNKDYADFAANGDYQNQIAAIQAKVQDAKLIQPSVSGQIGGDSFTLATQYWRCNAKVKIVNEGVMRMIGDFWLRYGYSINRWVSKIPNNLMVMRRFTYWKMRETYLSTATCPESYKQAIRGILEKGVTIWADANDIGNVDIKNDVISGKYY